MVQEHACRPLELALRRGVQLKFLADLRVRFIDLEIEHGIRIARESAVECFINRGSAIARQADELGEAQVLADLNAGTALVQSAERIENAVQSLRIAGVGHVARRRRARGRHVSLGKVLMRIIEDQLDRGGIARREHPLAADRQILCLVDFAVGEGVAAEARALILVVNGQIGRDRVRDAAGDVKIAGGGVVAAVAASTYPPNFCVGSLVVIWIKPPVAFLPNSVPCGPLSTSTCSMLFNVSTDPIIAPYKCRRRTKPRGSPRPARWPLFR